MISRALSPSARAASTNSISRSESVCARTMRAMFVQVSMPVMIITFQMLGPKIAATVIVMT